ncbi:MAG: hypothetical protein ACOCUP_02425 [bacterium]
MKKSHKLTCRLFILIFISFFLLFTNSCLDPEWDFEKFSDEVVLTPGIAAPLVHGTLSLDQVLNKLDGTNYVKRFDDSLLYISYANRVISYPANEVVEIPNQNFLEFFIESDVALSPEWIGAEVGDTVSFHKDKSGEFSFPNNERIDSIHIKTMDLVIDVQSSFKHTGILTITSENILVDGEAFQEVIQISDASGNFSISRTIVMDGNTVYLDNTDPSTTILPLTFDFDLINSGNPVLAGESLDITMTFVDPEFYSLFGYLGDYELFLSSDDVVIDIFDTDSITGGGSIQFADPIFNLDIANSYGLPVLLNISELEAYSRINDVTSEVVFEPGLNPFTISAPGLDAVGDTANTLIAINKETSNIDEVIQTSPREFMYTVSAVTNPGGSQAATNFVTDSSDFLVDFEIILPIWIKAEGFTMEETYPFNFEERFGDNTDMVDYLRFTLDATNGLPLEVNMQVYFLDQFSNILDSLYTNDDFLLPASLNAGSKVEEPTEQSKAIEFTKGRIEAIKPATDLLIKASGTTADAESDKFVKIYSYYTVDFKFKMKADLNLNSRDQ